MGVSIKITDINKLDVSNPRLRTNIKYLLVNRAIIYIVVRHGQKSFFSSKVEQWQISHKKKQCVYDSSSYPYRGAFGPEKGPRK